MATRTVHQRRRLVALSLVIIVAGSLVIALAYTKGDGRESRGPLPPKATRVLPPVDPLRYVASRRADYERHAALGLSHVIYAKTPGGVLASAQRTERFRAIYARGTGSTPTRSPRSRCWSRPGAPTPRRPAT